MKRWGAGIKRVIQLCTILMMLIPAPAAQASLYCDPFGTCYGGEGELPWFFQCDSGLAIAADLLCHAECGGHAEAACFGGTCDPGNALNPGNLTQCTSCGGQSEPICPDLASPCDYGYTPDPANLLLTCTACGREGQIVCGLGGCFEGFTPDPGNLLLTCTTCGGPDQWPCQPLNPAVANCQDGLEVWLNGKCQTCGINLGPTCSPGPACEPWHNEVADLVDVFGTGVLDLIEALDFLDVIPGVCVSCGSLGELVCNEGPICKTSPDARSWLGFCQYTGYAGEPTTNSTVEVKKQTTDEAVWGWVDTHEHQFANEAYGGAMFWGKPFDPEGANKALAWCDYTRDFRTELPILADIDSPIVTAFNDTLADIDGRGYPVHGSHLGWVPTQYAFGFTNNIATNTSLHDVTGVKEDPFIDSLAGTILDPFLHQNPTDHAWPHYQDGGHQQMYYRWLKRAYEGGQRVLINIPVNNEVLCQLSLRREGYSCEDMASADIQIEGIKALERFIDLENDGLVNNNGWYRIAYSPSEARRIIEDGAMAVIISIEVDSLFGCKPGTEDTFCTEDYIRDQLDTLYAKGVRHVFPVHLFDNAFAGADLYGDIFAIANILATGGNFIQTYDCSGEEEGFSFKLTQGQIQDALNLLGDTVLADLTLPTIEEMVDFAMSAHCNKKGLTERGQQLLAAMMDKRIIIDIDHLSHRALEGYWGGDTYHKGALDLLKERSYPPFSGHTVVTPDGKAGTEFGLTVSQVKRIRDMGGLIAITAPRGDDPLDEMGRGTTKTFVHGPHSQDGSGRGMLGYNDIVNLMKKSSDDHYPRISLIADFGCFQDQLGPRFISSGDGLLPKYDGDDAAPLKYPFAGFYPGMVPGQERDRAKGGEFDYQETGQRQFNFNTDGLAHFGLFPDLLADAADNYDADLTPLFNSAEAFLQMWEQMWPTGPVAHWTFDEADGDVAYDSAVVESDERTKQDGVIKGAVRVEGRVGNALHFDGLDDFIDFGNPVALQIANDQTISMWIKPSDLSEERCIFTKAFAGEGEIDIDTDGILSYYYGILGSNEFNPDTHYDRYILAGAPLELDAWTHLVIVRDLTHKKIRWYKNGQPIGTLDADLIQAKASDKNACLGKGLVSDGYVYNKNFAGDLDEVKIYDLALTDAKVLELYDEVANPGDSPGNDDQNAGGGSGGGGCFINTLSN